MTDVPEGGSPRRWWSNIRWITGFVILAIVGSLLGGLFGPEPRIVVSRETTFITAPLLPDGLPDYPAYVLDRLGRGTPPEDNAAVAVLHATWPMELDGPKLAAVCKALGIPVTPPDVAPLVWAEDDEELRSQLGELLAAAPPSGAAAADPEFDSRAKVGGVIDRSRSEPWRAAECPPLEDWVERNAAVLDLVVAGASRPVYEMPSADLLAMGAVEPVLVASLTDVQTLRSVARALATRAMLHTGEGRHAAAWRDIHAIHRLARLLSPAERGGFMVANLVSVAIAATANGLTLELLQAPAISAEVISTVRRDLDALPPWAEGAAALEMERIGGLDLLMHVSHTRRHASSVIVDLPMLHLRTSLDVNVMLRDFNSFYDRVDAVARCPDQAARVRAHAELDEWLTAQVSTAGPLRLAGWWLRMATSRSARSADMAARLLCVVAPAAEAYLAAMHRGRAEFELLHVAAVLAEYRGRGDAEPTYPDTLDALVPDVLAEVPRDPFSGGPLVYERRGDGYLLYAVGANGVDDGGTSGDIVKGDWQPPDPFGSGPAHGLDTVIRVPTPRRGLVPTTTP